MAATGLTELHSRFLERARVLASQLDGLETVASSLLPTSVAGSPAERYTLKEFRTLWQRLAVELVDEAVTVFEAPAHTRDWLRANLDYNVPGGKLNRGLSVVHTTLHIKPDASPALIEQAAVLGWCVELLQAYFLVADDIMDSSITRRGQPCWYRADAPVQLNGRPGASRERVGLIAINDGMVLEAIIYRLLKKYFDEQPFYVNLLEIFLETTYQTELGQMLDLLSQPQGEGNVDLSTLNHKAYSKIVIYKTAFYSFYLPVALGMLLTGYQFKKDRAAFDEALSILIPMGEFFQIQDDYLDCYGDPKVIGKVGRDIEEKKCGWLAATAIAKASPADRQLFEANYGREDPASVALIKQLYLKLDVAGEYHKCEESSYRDITSKINQPTLVPKPVYLDFLKKIYKRQA